MKENRLIPKRRFKEFENDGAWEQRKLEDGTSRIGDGLHGTPKYTEDGKVYFINGNNLVNGKIVITKETKCVTKEDQSKNDKALGDNTILMSINGTIGNLAWYNGEKLMLGKSVGYINLLDLKKTFIYAYLQTPSVYNYFMNNLTGSTIKNLGLKTIRETEILVPTKEEQLNIGKLFTNIDSLISLHQRKLKKMKDLKSAYLSEMFPKEGEKYPKRRFAGFTDSWGKRKLGDVAPLRGGSAFQSSRYCNGGIPIVRISNILSDGTVGGEFARYIQQEDDSSFVLKNGDILLAMSGATTGKVSILRCRNTDKYYQNQRVGVFKRNHEVDYSYVSTLVRSELFFKQLKNVLVAGAQPNVSSKDIDFFEFMFPKNREEQTKIGKLFDKIDNLITLHQHKLEKLENIKKAYLNEMFV